MRCSLLDLRPSFLKGFRLNFILRSFGTDSLYSTVIIVEDDRGNFAVREGLTRETCSSQ